jgi:hypothetical protein
VATSYGKQRQKGYDVKNVKTFEEMDPKNE